MSEILDRKIAAMHARLAEAWLALGAKLEMPAMALTVLASAILLWKPTSLAVLASLVCVIALGVLGQYFAMRVAFDCKLFLQWADRWESDAVADPVADMAILDAALASAGLRDSASPSRSLQSRQHGAFGLFRKQAITFLLQCVALLLSVAFVHWGG